MEKYVWLNTVTGEFSNSFDIKDFDLAQEKLDNFITESVKELKKEYTENNGVLDRKTAFKLIKYTCLNDDDFSFNIHMKLR